MSKEERKMTQEEKAAKQEQKQGKGRERLETQRWSQKVNDKGIYRYGKDTDIKDQRLRNSQQILWDSNKGENELHNDQIVLLLNLFTMPFAGNLWMTRRVCIYLGESFSCKKTRTNILPNLVLVIYYFYHMQWKISIARKPDHQWTGSNAFCLSKLQKHFWKSVPNLLQLYPTCTSPCLYHIQKKHCSWGNRRAEEKQQKVGNKHYWQKQKQTHILMPFFNGYNCFKV